MRNLLLKVLLTFFLTLLAAPALLAGEFQLAGTFPAGPGYALVTADLNMDGKLDLILSCYSGSGSMAVMLGNGDSTFQPPAFYNGGLGGAVAVADMNEDGKLDLVTGETQGLVVFYGNGDGTFNPAVPLTNKVGGGSALAIADFNGDGHLDAVVGYYFGAISVTLGHGNGVFDSPNVYTTGTNPTVAVGDINNDGKLDLVVSDYELNYPFGGISPFLGNGDGTFAPTGPFQQTVGSFGSVSLADFNGDGKLDAGMAADGGVGVMLGDGMGNFSDVVLYDNSPYELGLSVVADMNNDGKPDIVSPDGLYSGPGMATVFLNGTKGLWSGVNYLTADSNPDAIAVGDFNGDGLRDIAAFSVNDRTISILLNTGVIALAHFVPTTVDFGAVPIKHNSRQSIVLSNRGTTTMVISSISVTSGYDNFKLARTDCGATLAVGAHCEMQVQFWPAVGSYYYGTLSVVDDAAGPQKIPLQGHGL